MRLSPAHFNRHLYHMGQRLSWERSYACSCVSPTSGQPDPKHKLCGGRGRIWDPGIETVVGVTKQQVDQQIVAQGQYDTGDLTLTVQEDSVMWDLAGKFDRIVLLNSTDVFSLPLKHNDITERVRYRVEKFTRVFWTDNAGNLVEGGLPVMAADGTLTWPNGGEPPDATTYSLSGVRYDEYFIYNYLPSDRNEHRGAPLPKRIQCRKWDLFGKSATQLGPIR